MTWPAVGKYQLTTKRVILIATVLLDLTLLATGRGGEFLAFILLVWGSWVLFRHLRSRVLWKLRNRLIVTYVFIAVVPIALILALFFVAGWLLTAQFAGYLVSSAVDHREAAIETPARLLARELPADRMAIMQQLTATGIPSFEALVTGNQTFRYPANATIQMPPGDWKDYTGVVYKDNRHYLMSLVNSGRNRSLILVPLTKELLANLVPGLGTLRKPEVTEQPNMLCVPVNGHIVCFSNVVAGVAPPQYNVLDVSVTGLAPIGLADWEHPNSGVPSVILVDTRLSAVLGIVFPSAVESSQLFLYAFFIIVALLGVAELISLFIGVSMTRTITGAVHNLYLGTTRIGEGDFAHRIKVSKGRDQLADLGRSFNQMADQLQQFVVVTKEKSGFNPRLLSRAKSRPGSFRANRLTRKLSKCWASAMPPAWSRAIITTTLRRRMASSPWR